MKNKTLGNWLIATFAVIVMGMVLEYDAPEFAGVLLLVGGGMIWLFGVWAIVRLYKLEDK